MATGSKGGGPVSFWGAKTPQAQLTDPGLSMPTAANVTPAPGQRSDQAKAQRAALTQTPHGGATGLLSEWTGPSLAHLLTTGHVDSGAGLALDTLGLLPISRGPRAIIEGVRAAHAAEAGVKATEAARAAADSYQAGKGLVAPVAKKVAGYAPRTLVHNELAQQLPKARSRITNVGERLVDKASTALSQSPHIVNTPGVRLVTTGERVAKAAGRSQRVEMGRADAALAEHLKAIKAVKEGSPEDQANFWYAQLPKTHRNAEGLALVRGKQAEELHRITSGQALADLTAQENAVKAKMAEARAEDPTGKTVLPFLQDLEDLAVRKTDLPARANDTAASIGQLDKLIANPPAENEAATAAVHALNAVREPILADANRLHGVRADNRKGIVAKWLGLEPTGQEAYIGHRLPRPETSRFPFTPSGGTGRVKSPQGVGSKNTLELATTGRLRPTLRVALEDHASGQTFRAANQARDDLGKMGVPYKPGTHVPGEHLLINPKGRTVPAHWKPEDLAQFGGDYSDTEQIRKQASDIVSEFAGSDAAGWDKIKADAAAQGVPWNELRVIPKRQVDRYYSQFRSAKSAGAALKAYDGLVDLVSTSIVFARLGYVPKNLAQNVIMAVPHQGAMLPINAVRAAQAAADPELRHLIAAEVGGTGATGSLGNQMLHKKILGGITNVVSKAADDPIRFSAFMHEAAGQGVISRANPLLTQKDHAALLSLFKDPSQRPLLNDIRSASVEAMADFSRMTPDQAKMARRFLIIPGWLMAGTRYPFHFALTHPIRSALLAYIAMGEPGAPKGLQFNKPVDQYFHGKGYKQGIDTPYGRFRTNSLSPVSTPIDLAQSVAGTIRGKQGPFDFNTPTIFDSANPFAGALINIAQGGGIKRNLQRLVPGEKFIEQEIHPKASSTYPGDATRRGRLLRELGVVPIPINDAPTKASRSSGGGSFWGGGSSSSGSASSGSSFWGK